VPATDGGWIRAALRGWVGPLAMIDLRPVLFVVGTLICALGVAMLLPAIVNWLAGVPPPEPFSIAALLAICIGGLFVLANRGTLGAMNLRQAYVLTFLAWLSVPAVGALPLVLSELDLSYTDAFFETMSGVTTTGSTVLVGLDAMPHSILLWRALMQWLGGIGIVVMAIAILPWLRTGGMQLFHAESSDRSDKPMPRLAAVTTALCLAYVVLTLVCSVAYATTGMTQFDAITHAMTTLSTGGYSTRDASFGGFSPGAQWVGVVFMIAGALPFVLYLRAVRGDWSILRDRQMRIMMLLLLISVIALTLWLYEHGGWMLDEALRHAAFNVVSIMTTTGYASDDYAGWGPLAEVMFFYLMFVGGCTGSTSGAIKIFRFRVLLIVLHEHLRRRFMPHLIAHRTYDGKPLSTDVVDGVMAFLAVYFLAVALAALTLGAFGLDFITALSGAVQAIGNIGPGLGETIGPAGNFSSLPDGAKWVLALTMLLGRLELFTVLVLLTPRFWRG
jgi:trk system potassium uptake protein